MSIRVSGGPELRRALEQAGERAKQLAGRAIYIEAERVMARSIGESPVGVDGVLRTSGFVRLPVTGVGKITVTMGYGGAASGYALAVHEGTRPHFPPVEALRPWARKKLGDEKLAYVVARKIARVGTRPTKFLERPLREAANGMGRRLARYIRSGLGA